MRIRRIAALALLAAVVGGGVAAAVQGDAAHSDAGRPRPYISTW